MLARPLATYCSEYGLDSVEPVGFTGVHEWRAVVGAYTLASSGERVGGLHLVRGSLVAPHIKVCAFSKLPAVLDLHVEDSLNPCVLAACADGSVRNVELANMRELWSVDVGAMALSLTNAQFGRNCGRVVVSCSDGKISVLQTGGASGRILHERKVHNAEAWTVDGVDENVIISGGDDGLLIVTDWREESAVLKKRAHGGIGITSIVCRPEHRLWSGGYDDYVRVWDRRVMTQPMAESDVGGGVWRLKFHPRNPELVLAACMYNGFKVVQMRENSVLETLVHYENHESIGYGAAWLCGEDDNDGDGLFALTGSFYDKSLQLWAIDGT